MYHFEEYLLELRWAIETKDRVEFSEKMEASGQQLEKLDINLPPRKICLNLFGIL